MLAKPNSVDGLRDGGHTRGITANDLRDGGHTRGITVRNEGPTSMRTAASAREQHQLLDAS